MRLLVLAWMAAALAAAEDVPGWVREVAAVQAPSYPPKVAHLVLLSEEKLTVDAEGRRVMEERGAIKILQKSSERLGAYSYYNNKSGRIVSFQGWLLPPSGKPKTFGKSAIVDHADVEAKTPDSEYRIQELDPGQNQEPGTVFAWRIVSQEDSVFTFHEYMFQRSDPVLVSRCVLTTPPGWEVRGATFHHAPVEPQVTGTTYTWELRDLPWIEHEDYSPGLSAVAPRLGVNFFPSAGSKPELRPLKDWSAVAAWFSGLSDPSSEVTPAVRQKSAELTANATTELDRIRAIATFVQKTSYVSLPTDLARGGGYRPRRADEVLATNYGDCKDKASLMKALLGAAGIGSHLISVDATDRYYVQPAWPAPQFNHAIIAIRVSPEIKLPAVIEHPSFGRLMFFDPTSEVTPVGDLPQGEQGSHALVETTAKGELVVLPLFEPALNRIESAVEGKLSAEGQLSARVSRKYVGQSAPAIRRIILFEKKDELKRAFERGLSQRLGGLTIDRIEPTDHFDDGRLDLALDLSVKQFGRLMQGRLLLLSPGDLAPDSRYSFAAKERKLPVRLYASSTAATVAISVPPEFKPDEVPEPVELDTPYGSYHAEWKVEGAQVRFEDTLVIKDVLAPAAEYAKVRAFFEEVTAQKNSAVVLVK